MRTATICLTAWLLSGAVARAQLQEVRVEFDDGGCVTCAESIETRLGRVRGVEETELDLEKGVVRLRLAEDNRVRLLPLVSRVGQGGAKVLQVCLSVRGAVEKDGDAVKFRTGGVGEVFGLEGDLPPAAGEVLLEAEAVDVEGRLLRVDGQCGG